MVTKEKEIVFLWETPVIDQLKRLSKTESDDKLGMLYLQLYNASLNISETFQQLSLNQRETFIQQVTVTFAESNEIQEHLVPDPEYITTNEVSKLLGISPQAVRKWCESKKLDATRTFGEYGEWRIDTSQFKKNAELAKKYRNLIFENRQKQLRTHRALKEMNLENLPGYKETFGETKEDNE
ncbi:helix-turn-helix domain-containing protein [Paenibacillus sp. V4I9]|uniref:helix-turn-helix domain-containing protein n=1 Tax=Paenibacillus sp. V4I9 TaxID=3042308 RepID=UPI0027D771A9|nr:helix-turn-helix domain-containing protein [Paenibacillus sp. V4I9]